MECNFDGNTDRLFCLGAYYFFKSSRKRSKIKELTFEDNVVEQDRLACMWEEGLTDPLAEQTRHKALTEIIGQEKAIRALRAALCGPNPQHVLIYGPPGVGKTAAARLILEEAKALEESPFRQKAKFVEIDAGGRGRTGRWASPSPDRVRFARRTAAFFLSMKSGSCTRFR